tara:strand:- start:18378 stop:19166 length:789 start_codon:yes stop_codon:yes gene_type:complete
VAKLPKQISESSGMVQIKEGTVWTLEDHGNKNELYEVDLSGKLLRELTIKNAENNDWEDLAKDPEGNVYISDSGNNSNDREDLTIYKIANPEKTQENELQAEVIRFSYPEQKKFPPKKDRLFYDSEALFFYKDDLYLITKNRARPFSGEALVYKVPAKKGNYSAQLVGSFVSCGEAGNCMVTAADISSDGSKVVLLGYGKLWVFTDFEGANFTTGTMETVELGATTQLESVCFVGTSNTELLLSDEKKGNGGQNLYSYTLGE